MHRYNMNRFKQRTALLAQCFAESIGASAVLAGGTGRRHWPVLAGTGRYWPVLAGTGRRHRVVQAGSTCRYWAVLAGTGRHWAALSAVLAGSTGRYCTGLFSALRSVPRGALLYALRSVSLTSALSASPHSAASGHGGLGAAAWRHVGCHSVPLSGNEPGPASGPAHTSLRLRPHRRRLRA
jgi:hypothetical protein